MQNGELDVLCHMMEASYSRINHCDEVFEVGKLYDVVVISVDETKQQVGVSRKKIFPDPSMILMSIKSIQKSKLL